MQWHHEEHLNHRCHLQELWLWQLPNQEVEEVEEVPKEMVVYWWVVVVEADAVKNVDWELTRDWVWQWSDVDMNVYGCEV